MGRRRGCPRTGHIMAMPRHGRNAQETFRPTVSRVHGREQPHTNLTRRERGQHYLFVAPFGTSDDKFCRSVGHDGSIRGRRGPPGGWPLFQTRFKRGHGVEFVRGWRQVHSEASHPAGWGCRVRVCRYCVDMHVDLCLDMRLDMHTGAASESVPSPTLTTCTEMRTYFETYIHMWVDIRTDMYIDMCAHMCL